MKTIVSLLLVSIIFIFNACKDKDCTKDGSCPPQFYRFELGEAKSYLWALPGSYWIYKNTKTGDLDTQVCISLFVDTITVKGKQDFSRFKTVTYDKLYRTIHSSFNDWNYVDVTGNPGVDGISFKNEYRIIIDRQVSDEGIITPFFYPFQTGTYSGNGSSNTECKGMDSTMQLQGKTYFNVAKFEIDMDNIWYPNDHPVATRYPNANFYWAKDVGLIKRENKSENYSWELIDYYIVK
jgi:hypothetical protein